jgi:ABC-type lipoprotein release transport system permease subunit
MAIRVALGAARSGIFLSLVRSALIASVAGLSIGIALLVGVRGLLSSILFGVSVLDFKVYFAVAGGISLLVALASIVPARQVLKLNPQKLLRDL